MNKVFIYIRLRPGIATARRGLSQGAGDLHKNFVKIDPAVPEICSRTDRHTDRQTGGSQYIAPLPGPSNSYN